MPTATPSPEMLSFVGTFFNQTVLGRSLYALGLTAVEYLPGLIIAFVLAVAGIVIGLVAESLIEKFFRMIRLDDILRRIQVEGVLQRAGFRLDIGSFVGALTRWFFIVAFLIAALSVLHLDKVIDVLAYVLFTMMPIILKVVFILLGASLISDITYKLISGFGRAASIHSSNIVASVSRWIILIFSMWTVLTVVLEVQNDFLLICLQGVVVAAALGFGLAFGFGGQDAAREYIAKIRQEIKRHDVK